MAQWLPKIPLKIYRPYAGAFPPLKQNGKSAVLGLAAAIIVLLEDEPGAVIPVAIEVDGRLAPLAYEAAVRDLHSQAKRCAVVSIDQRRPTELRRIGERVGSRGCRRVLQQRRLPAETPLFLEVFLCLSRACLGKCSGASV